MLSQVDVRKAHRQIRIKGSDWGLLGCRADDKSSDVYLNKVGTFGVASAGYWWSRLAALIVRLVHYRLGAELAIWLLLYSDDGALFAHGREFPKKLIMAMFILELFGVPMSWRKTRGGVKGDWVG